MNNICPTCGTRYDCRNQGKTRMGENYCSLTCADNYHPAMKKLITPGQWKYGFNCQDPTLQYIGGAIVSDGKRPLAASPGAASGVPADQKRANIIIMSFAPAMLEMLERISGDASNGYHVTDGIGTIGGDMNALIGELADLISPHKA